MKPSPLSNRGYERSEHPRSTNNLKECTLNGCPLQRTAATPSESYSLTSCHPRGCSLRSYPRLLRGDAFSVICANCYITAKIRVSARHPVGVTLDTSRSEQSPSSSDILRNLITFRVKKTARITVKKRSK